MKSVELMDKMKKDLKISVRSHMEVLTPTQVKKIRLKLPEVSKAPPSTSKKKVIRRQGATPSRSTTSPSRLAQPSSPQKPQAKTLGASKQRIIRRKKSDSIPVKKAPTTSPAEKPDKTLKVLKPSSPGVAQKQIVQNVRSGFTSIEASDPMHTIDEEIKKEAPRKPLVEKEIETKFQASDFRKREIVFQPKKKRINLSGDIKKTQITKPKAHKRVLKVYGEMSIEDVAKNLGVKQRDFRRKLKSEGIDWKETKVLDFDTIALIASEFDFEAKNVKKSETELLKSVQQDKTQTPTKEASTPRSPVVTVMGHVDHGKTTLLDAIRKTKVVDQEAGGITQHIGAYSVPTGSGFVTFIDTPGHEAFTAMRSRGASVTDIVILVVSATDGVMPQTVESINHAKVAKTPIIVAVNKMDVPGADMEKIKKQMAEHEVLSEEWGGDSRFIPVSAIQGEGIQELLEQVQLLAEVQELKGHPKKPAYGTVIESRLEKGFGVVSTVIVQDGTLKPGDSLVVGTTTGRVRQIKDDQGKILKEAPPSFPVEITGLQSLPGSGDRFDVVKNEKMARELIEVRKSSQKLEQPDQPELSVEELLLQTYSKDAKKEELNIVLKSDVSGSLEAIKFGLEKFDTENVSVKVIHSGAGSITESDILLASTVEGVVIGFQVRPDSKATKMAKEKGVDIHTYSIIYELLDSVKKMLFGLLKPDLIEEETGKAEVREIYRISKVGTVAGCLVQSGEIQRNNFVHLVRDGKIVFSGKISSLKRFKDDVKKVAHGYECGIAIENFNDIKPKDILEGYNKKEIQKQEL